MIRPDDYSNEMPPGITNEEAERLLSDRDPERSDLAELTQLLAALRREGETVPGREQTSSMASRLAIAARAEAAPGDPRRRPGTRLRKKAALATATIGVVLLIGATGIAAAANGAIPGDPLYGLDRAFEAIGLGNGGAEERIDEADELLIKGDESGALAFLGESLIELISEGDQEAASRIQRHLELAVTKTSPSAEAAQEKVAELRAFIEENKGNGHGREFGHGVSEIARDRTHVEPETSGPREEPDPSPPDNAGPKDDRGNAPEHAGPKDAPDKSEQPGKTQEGEGIEEKGQANGKGQGQGRGEGNGQKQGQGNSKSQGQNNGNGPGQGNPKGK